MTNNSNSVSKGFLWKLLERLFSQGLNLVVQIILARIILKEDFGYLAIIVAVTNYLSLFVQSGVSTAIIQKKDIEKKDVSTMLTFSLIVALIFYVALFFTAPFIASVYDNESLANPLRVLGVVLFLNAINSVQVALLSRNLNFKAAFISTVISVPVCGVVSIVMALYGFGIWALVTHNVFSMFIIVVVLLFKKDLRVPLGFSWASFKKLYSFSLKILISSLISGAYDFLRTLFIGYKYTEDELALYDKGNTYSYYSISIINATVTAVLLPTFSKEQDDLDKVKAISRKSTSLTSFLVLPMLAGIALVSYPLVYVLLTEKWIDCAIYLSIFCILRIPTFFTSIDKQVYLSLGKSGINLIYEIVICSTNLALLIAFLGTGVVWIAISALIVEFLGFVALSIVSSKVYNYSLKERLIDMWKPVLSTIIMGIATFLIGILINPVLLRLILQVFTGLVTFIIMSIVLKDNNLFYIIGKIKVVGKIKKEKRND